MQAVDGGGNFLIELVADNGHAFAVKSLHHPIRKRHRVEACSPNTTHSR